MIYFSIMSMAFSRTRQLDGGTLKVKQPAGGESFLPQPETPSLIMGYILVVERMENR